MPSSSGCDAGSRRAIGTSSPPTPIAAFGLEARRRAPECQAADAAPPADGEPPHSETRTRLTQGPCASSRHVTMPTFGIDNPCVKACTCFMRVDPSLTGAAMTDHNQAPMNPACEQTTMWSAVTRESSLCACSTRAIRSSNDSASPPSRQRRVAAGPVGGHGRCAVANRRARPAIGVEERELVHGPLLDRDVRVAPEEGFDRLLAASVPGRDHQVRAGKPLRQRLGLPLTSRGQRYRRGPLGRQPGIRGTLRVSDQIDDHAGDWNTTLERLPTV